MLIHSKVLALWPLTSCVLLWFSDKKDPQQLQASTGTHTQTETDNNEHRQTGASTERCSQQETNWDRRVQTNRLRTAHAHRHRARLTHTDTAGQPAETLGRRFVRQQLKLMLERWSQYLVYVQRAFEKLHSLSEIWKSRSCFAYHDLPHL